MNHKKIRKMQASLVGEFAGLIWRTLEGEDRLSYKEIIKITKLKQKEFYLGLGWLLREDKINVHDSDGELLFSLKK